VRVSGRSTFRTASNSPTRWGATDDFVNREPAGGTCVFAPDGTVVADSIAGEEAIV
jgi:hypothetical protein